MFNLNKIVKEYDAIFVDVDNTLFNYSYSHSKALNAVLKKYNFTMADYKKAKIVIKKRDLKSNHHKKELYFKIMCESRGISFLDALGMYETYTEVFDENLLVDKSMLNMLKFAKEENKTVIAITNYYVIPQIRKLKHSNFTKYIDYLITSEEFEVEKPNLKLFNKAIELSKTSKDKIIMLGDSVVDDLSHFNLKSYPYNCSKLLISISGKSGAGKSTLSSVITDVFDCTVIEGDGYHKYERNHTEWQNVTHYNPDANNLVQLSLDIKNIYQDIGSVKIPIYNHSNGLFEMPSELDNNKLDVVLIDGLHSLYKEVTGDFVKIKIFIDNIHADNQKLLRDTAKRNKTEAEVQKSITSREEDYVKYIQLQKDYCNFLIQISETEAIIKISKELNLNLNSLNKELINSINGTNDNIVITASYENVKNVVRDIMVNLKNERWV